MSQKYSFLGFIFLGYITNEYPRVVRPAVRSRGLSASRWTTGGLIPPSGDGFRNPRSLVFGCRGGSSDHPLRGMKRPLPSSCLLYTSDAADERSSVDLGGR